MKLVGLIFGGILYYIGLFFIVRSIFRVFQIRRIKTGYFLMGIFVSVPVFCIFDYVYRGNPILIFFGSIGYVIAAFLLYFILTLGVLILLKRILRWILRNPSKLLSTFSKKAIIGSVATGMVVCCIGFFCAVMPTTTELSVGTGKTEYRIVAVSDIHYGSTGSVVSLPRMVRQINEKNPDLIFLLGDVFDNKIKAIDTAYFLHQLDRLSAPYGVYAITGNHEFINNSLEEITDLYRPSSLKLLLDEEVSVNNQFRILGRIDVRHPRKEIDAIVTSSELPLIVLDHQPQNYRDAQKISSVLQLSGHTHNGQIFPGNWLIWGLNRLLYQSESNGFHRYGNFSLEITKGYGTWGFPFRLTGNSEILEIHFWV